MVAPSRPFVGRGRELAELEAGLGAALSGRGSLFLVAGEPGIGKTRLCDELGRRAEERGFAVLTGRSWEASGAPAYWPWIQVLRGLVRGSARSSFPEDVRAALQDLLPQLDDAGPASVRSSAAEERFRLFDAVTTSLCDAANHAPLLVVLEDVHAADPSSLALLAFFARELRVAPICAVATYREQEARENGRTDEAIALLAREGTLVLPARFGRGDVERLMLARSGVAPAAEMVDAVFRTTEGHPLFVDEVYRAIERGPGPGSGEPLHLPDTVRHAIRERLSRLGPGTRELLAAAAVLGREFALETVARVLHAEPAALAHALEGALRSAVVVSAGERAYAFNHALVRDAIYRDVPRERRAALHAAAASALEREEPAERALNEIALHLLEAAPAVGEDRALSGARRAAERALAKYAFEDAAVLLKRAIDALEPKVTDARGLGEAFVLLGEALVKEGKDGTFACLRAAEIGRRIAEPELVARAGLSLGAEITPAVVNQTLVALLQEALAALPPEPGALRARVLARLAGAMQPALDPTVPVGLAREAIAMARSLGDDDTLRFVLLGAGSALVEYVKPRERADFDEETLRLARAVGDAPLEFRARLRLFYDHVELGNTLQADTNLVECERLAVVLRHPRYEFYARMIRATRAVTDGRFAEAFECERDAEALVRRLGDAPLAAGLAHHRFGKALLRHEDDRLEAIADGFFELIRPISPRWVALVRAWIRMRHGQLEDAEAFVETLPEDSPLNRLEISAMQPLCEMRLHTGQGARSDALLEALESRRDTFVSWGIFGMALFAPMTWLIGCVHAARGDLAAANRNFEDAEARAEAAGARPALAHVLHDHAFALVVRFEEKDAAAPILARCRALAEELKLPRLAAKVDALAGAPRKAQERDHAGAPSERLPALRFSVVKDGETWTVTRGRRSFRLKDSRGLQMLAELIAAEGRELHVLSLGAGGDPGDLGDAGEVIDAEAARAYRSRIEALRDREREAEDGFDLARASQARQEIEFLGQQLAEGIGLGGKGRRAAAAAERARTNVQRRLRDAIRRIEEHDPELGRYLRWTIRTGTFCSFVPGQRK